MKKGLGIFTVFAAVFLIAATASVVTLWFSSRPHKPAHPDAHEWVHTQLGITPEQEKILAPVEAKYRQRSEELMLVMRQGNEELAKAILADGQDSQRVHAAIEKIHDAMGQLQNVTIGHVFEMRGALTDTQYQKLLRLTADALCQLESDPGDHGSR